ncbi:MucBP domain-containing protein [Tepidibacter hydrothermalis]|uniref:MucBP domain-containing protein n=1 Tax=Tepidibacter hydrothermalis TaxID=3036126 RepID=A0ABY8EHW4_9FIRM|nr:MucBP domain-containing protein [Tepidibacter hydrothermalis]WFD11194.1 MucBP domain-containing protein [Tepidibacter hydrothermalis]
MKWFSKQRTSILMLFTLIVQLFVPYFTNEAFAEDPIQDPSGLSVVIKEVVTGTEPFNTTNKSGPGFYPGDDYSKDDNYVRTLDTVAYTIDYGINPAGSVAKNAVLTATLSADASGKPIAVWDSNLVNLYSGLSITDDGRKLEYKLGDKDGGNAYGFSPAAKILGTAKNEEKFNLDVTFSSDNSARVSTSTKDIGKEITVSASPKLDLGIDCYRTETVVGPSGELGVLLSSTIEVLIKNGKGSENVTEDLNFDVDLSKFRELGLSPILYNFLNKKPVAESGAWGGVQASSLAPDGKGGGEKSVTDSGNFTATQSEAGGDVEITISGADLSGNHTPIKYLNGDIISLEDKYVVSGYLALWIPADQIPVGETEVEVSYKNFDPNSTSGQSNFREGIEPLENNKDTRKIRKPKGKGELSIDEYYIDIKGNHLPAEDDIWDRNGVLVSGAEFRTVVRMYNNGFEPIGDTVVVNKFDPNLVELIESAGVAHSIQSSSNINNEDIIVEYGTGEYSNWQEQRNAVDSNDGWYKNMNDVPGGSISKIRIRMKDGKNIPPKSDMSLKIYMKTKEKPIGTIIPNFLSYKSSELNNGEWKHSSYDAINDTNYGYRSDRVTITGAEARIEVNSDKDTVKAGDTVKYTIKSTLTADPPGTYGTAENVEIIDILPEDLIYVTNSAKRGSSYLEPKITHNSDGTTTLKWSLGDQLINEAMEDITFDVKVGIDAKNLTSLNDKVIIKTPTDISREAVRTSQKTVTVTNDTAWGVYKTVDKEKVEIEEDLAYTLNYFQLTDKTLNNFEFIDILPYNGDGRSPNTGFNGYYTLKSIYGKHGETFLVTDATPESINRDPKIGGITWSSIGSIDPKNVTAIKILVPDFPKNQPTREIKLVLEPKENKAEDIYTNNFTGRVSDIDAMVESNDVKIKVVSSSVEGLVWEDLNENGKVDLDENGILNIKVKLLDNNGASVLDNSGTPIETNTNINGEYKFENLKSGNYKVQIEDESLNNYKQTYEYDGSLDQISSVSLSKNQKLTDVNFGYKHNEGRLEVRYLEKGTGNELLLKEETTKAVGESYKTDKKEIAGYKFVSLDGLEEGQYVEGKTVVTYYYEKNPEIIKKGNVVVFHKWGEKLLKFEDLGEKEVGTEYTTNPLTEEKYKDFKVIVPENKDGKYIEGTIEVIYYYINTNPDKPIEPEKKIGEVVVRYLEKNTNKELDTEDLLKDEVGKDYITQEKQIDGYKILEKPSNAQGKYIEGKIEVIYYYEKETEKPIEPEKKMGEVIVKYLEKNTNKELAAEDSLKDEVGEDYSTQEKQIDGYKMIQKSSNTQGQYIEGTIEVIYYYEKEIEKTEERPSKKRKRKPKEEKVEIPDEEIPQGKPEVEVEIPDEEIPQGKPEIEVEIPDQEIPQGKPEVEVEIPDQEIPQGKPEIEVEIPDEEIPQGKPKLLPKTGEKVPYSNYVMGTLIMLLGGTLILRRRKNS